jgi:hypothetical protein
MKVLLSIVLSYSRSRESVVGIVNSYGLDDRGVRVRVAVESRIFSLLRVVQTGSGVHPTSQPPIQWITGALSPGVKRLGHEADHTPPTSAEVRKMWIYTSTTQTPSWRSA